MAVLVLLMLMMGSVEAAGAKSVKKGSAAERQKRREAKDKRKMAIKKKRKEARRAERKQRVKERVSVLKKQKRKQVSNKIKPLTAKGLKSSASKLKYMISETESSANGIVQLNSRSYKRYINDGPRGYFTLLVYTALGEKFRCSICKLMHREMIKLSRATNLTSFQPPVFLATLDYEDGGEVFDALQFNHVPIAVLIPPTNNTRKPAFATFYKALPQQFRLMSTGRLAAADFANFIERNTPISGISIPEPAPKLYKYVGLAIIVLIFSYLLITSVLYKNVLKYRDYVFPYFLLTLVFYAWCAGAGMYNIIRDTPWHGGHGDSIEYFYPSSGSQYIYGSMIVGSVNLAIGISVILLNTWALPDKAEKPANSIAWTLVRYSFRLVSNPYVFLALSIYIWWKLLGIYTRKNREYNFGAIRDHELFDSEKFYNDGLQWFKRTLIGKNAFRLYRRGNRNVRRIYRKHMEASFTMLMTYGYSKALELHNNYKPWLMEKIYKFQEAVDTNLLGIVKDEL